MNCLEYNFLFILNYFFFQPKCDLTNFFFVCEKEIKYNRILFQVIPLKKTKTMMMKMTCDSTLT
jgi:hypothetical protein